MGVTSPFYFDGVQKTFCKIAEQRNLLFGENSRASLGKFCLPHALNAVSDRLVAEVGRFLIPAALEVEVVVVIRRAGLLVDGHTDLQSRRAMTNGLLFIPKMRQQELVSGALLTVSGM